MIFYKGLLVKDLKDNFVPGSVTTSLTEARMWADRISSRKTKGAAKHVRHGKSCIISFEIDEKNLLSHEEFQRAGVSEHQRKNCWMNQVRSKAQINTVINNYSIIE